MWGVDAGAAPVSSSVAMAFGMWACCGRHVGFTVHWLGAGRIASVTSTNCGLPEHALHPSACCLTDELMTVPL